ncbi:telomerase reverse transcriptase catalytic subunit [Ectocarpus siliculosus]|uniref:Telomerase reverse transcriptase n=1 Tax=Ectocarpus siliculosus TaxID=2880 RepID=D7G5Y0_ECTSI|nr:telomerase reverse transcriptase catalytic subunit [Ectocarpus siliculosus]|eukprot:CBJ33900.1 telomerase reverse transcriptase catalytic subunit [Ectocarpus siliculosus]
MLVLRMYSKAGVAESLTVDSRRAGACLVGKMKRFLSPKCHALMLDEGEHLGINSRNTVLLNVYEMLLVCAAKTATSALRLPRGPAGNASLLSNGALETTAYAYSLIQNRSNRRNGSFGTSRGVRCVCKNHRFQVTWVGLPAFREVFGAFPMKDRGFARCKLHVESALRETAGSRGGGFEGFSRKIRKGKEGAAAAGWEEEATPDTQHGVRRGRAYGRLRRVVRSPDALSLLQTLTS